MTALLCPCHSTHAGPADLTEPIRVVRGVGLEGRGNPEGSAAWRTLAAGDASSILPLLQAMDGAAELSANWLRSAVETIADRELAAGRSLPVADLGRFLRESHRNPRARRFALELIARVDAPVANRLLAGMLNDPGAELRADAVQLIVRQAGAERAAGNKAGAALLFQHSLGFSRDAAQIEEIVKGLRELGEKVDVPRLFGFITSWQVVGPFDNAGGKGFDAVYPPEKSIDLSAELDGKSGKVKWSAYTTTEENGDVTMNKPFTHLKGATAYALTEFWSDQAQEVELRLGSENSWKLWLNGNYLFGQDEYHRNKAIDQYRMPAKLEPGRNVILVKVSQNEQTEDWADGWDFVLRVCDPSGAPVRSAGPATTDKGRKP